MDTFRILISGHIKNGLKPIFILHHNYTGPNVLQNHRPDFKSHKKEGNIDIFISGKFFTENILIEESVNSPPVLNITPHFIPIDEESNKRKEKFKDVYNVGTVDIVLEGEFITNEVTFKYTPILSLDIMKHNCIPVDPGIEAVNYKQTATTLLYRTQTQATPFESTQAIREEASERDWQLTNSHIVPKNHKHVHYVMKNEDDKSEPSCLNGEKEVRTKETDFLQKLKRNKLYKQLFSNNNKGHNTKNDSKLIASSEPFSEISKNKYDGKSLMSKSSLKWNKTRCKWNRQQDECKEDHTSRLNTSFHVNDESEKVRSYDRSKKCLTSEEFSTKGQGPTTKSHVSRKKKKRDNNQAIVENPILAQMQEFFIT